MIGKTLTAKLAGGLLVVGIATTALMGGSSTAHAGLPDLQQVSPQLQQFPQLFQPDLIVQSVSATQQVNGVVKLTVVIKNQGIVGTNDDIWMKVYVDGQLDGAPYMHTKGLAANSTKTLSKEIPSNDERRRTVAVMVDRYNQVDESNENNNWKSAAVVIQ
jgi:subtilase family serine protease